MRDFKNYLLNGLLIAAPALAHASDSSPHPLELNYDKGYLVFSSPDKSYQMKIDGRIMLDTGAVQAEKNNLKSDSEIRRARLAFKTVYDNTWAGEFDIDFAGNESKIKDMWVAYIAIPNTTIKIGNHKPHFSLAESTTSRWYPLMETPMVSDSFGVGRRIGLSASNWNKRYFIGLSVFGDDIGVSSADEDQSETFGYASRGLFRPLLSDDARRFTHIGYNYLHYSPQSDEDREIKFKAGLENEVADYKFLDTGKIDNVKDISTYGLEIAGQFDRWMFSGEYLNTSVSRDEGSADYESSGFYLESSYFLTGDGRSYNLSDGEFGPVIPSSEHGDLELILRYSTLDLSDDSADIYGGASDNVTLGLNWYAHKNVVFRLNYIHAAMDDNADDDGDLIGGDTVETYAMRIQYLF
ncbi:OprO/OprP family phosphate-selective porin [Agaribacterium haliotis]|uniref:OprO/OprP family phosphate-selective porin n=1 Tax=Agaribacterium haliotis TaxID=2013869 RepID=UPI000BB584D8|nr:porin [Agaribacterium haliotis]